MRAQAGIVEFIILVLLMLLLAQGSLELAGEARKNGVLLLQRAVVDRSLERMDFIIHELNLTGAGRQKVEVRDLPFIRYSLDKNGDEMTLTAISEWTNYSSSITVPPLNFTCDPLNRSNLTITIQAWDSKIEVIC